MYEPYKYFEICLYPKVDTYYIPSMSMSFATELYKKITFSTTNEFYIHTFVLDFSLEMNRLLQPILDLACKALYHRSTSRRLQSRHNQWGPGAVHLCQNPVQDTEYSVSSTVIYTIYCKVSIYSLGYY